MPPIRTLVGLRDPSARARMAAAFADDPRFDVAEGDDAATVLRCVSSWRPRLVILDPDVAGTDLALVAELRALLDEARIVVLTGDVGLEEQARRLGADAVYGIEVPPRWLATAAAALLPAESAVRSAPTPAVGRELASEISLALFEHSVDGVLFTAPDGRILAANPAACEMLGMSEAEVCARGRQGLTDPADPRWAAAVEERTRTGAFAGELSMLRAGGRPFPVEVSSAVFENARGELRTVVVMRDVSARKRAEARLAQLARVDDLTGVLNRRGFLDAAPERAAAAEAAGQAATVLFVDVDGLKDLNDAWGHATGDAALREAAALLGEVAGPDDLVARLGGDEFVVLAREPRDRAPTELARRVDQRFARRNAEGPRFPLRVSTGAVRLGPAGPASVEDAVDEADRAMRDRRRRERGGLRRRAR